MNFQYSLMNARVDCVRNKIDILLEDLENTNLLNICIWNFESIHTELQVPAKKLIHANLPNTDIDFGYDECKNLADDLTKIRVDLYILQNTLSSLNVDCDKITKSKSYWQYVFQIIIYFYSRSKLSNLLLALKDYPKSEILYYKIYFHEKAKLTHDAQIIEKFSLHKCIVQIEKYFCDPIDIYIKLLKSGLECDPPKQKEKLKEYLSKIFTSRIKTITDEKVLFEDDRKIHNFLSLMVRDYSFAKRWREIFDAKVELPLNCTIADLLFNIYLSYDVIYRLMEGMNINVLNITYSDNKWLYFYMVVNFLLQKNLQKIFIQEIDKHRIIYDKSVIELFLNHTYKEEPPYQSTDVLPSSFLTALAEKIVNYFPYESYPYESYAIETYLKKINIYPQEAIKEQESKTSYTIVLDVLKYLLQKNRLIDLMKALGESLDFHLLETHPKLLVVKFAHLEKDNDMKLVNDLISNFISPQTMRTMSLRCGYRIDDPNHILINFKEHYLQMVQFHRSEGTLGNWINEFATENFAFAKEWKSVYPNLQELSPEQIAIRELAFLAKEALHCFIQRDHMNFSLYHVNVDPFCIAIFEDNNLSYYEKSIFYLESSRLLHEWLSNLALEGFVFAKKYLNRLFSENHELIKSSFSLSQLSQIANQVSKKYNQEEIIESIMKTNSHHLTGHLRESKFYEDIIFLLHSIGKLQDWLNIIGEDFSQIK